ncbi:DUF2218 domain-containing protein [Sphingomonas gilva]|uniref:DUF2218 domain-containing protein n=1 Tax=Sphingomonas gilva TaxID=2305907 RepID=A0A396RKZ2_9SPHN|nr:DUF2218 domain-containing protein [Sphingomonas gilva]RHW16984.1 DUF2218 domain-containing protein [Sphingomonas gilva]
MSRSSAEVPTANASRYLQQLCKHWSHKMHVEFDAEKGRIAFPNGTIAELAAREDALAVTLDVPDGEDAGRMRRVVAEHLDRFAFREAPLAFDWK